MNCSEQTGELMTALSKAQAQVKMVNKAGVNNYDKYRYIDLPSILVAVRDASSANGLAVIHWPNDDTTQLWTRISHQSGQFIEVAFPMRVTTRKAGLPIGPRDDATAITYARKVALTALFMTAGDDDVIDDPDNLPDSQQNQRPDGKKPNGRDAPKGVGAARQAMAKQQGPAANDSAPQGSDARAEAEMAELMGEIRSVFVTTHDDESLHRAAQWVSSLKLPDGNVAKALAKAEYRKAAERLNPNTPAQPNVMAGA